MQCQRHFHREEAERRFRSHSWWNPRPAESGVLEPGGIPPCQLQRAANEIQHYRQLLALCWKCLPAETIVTSIEPVEPAGIASGDPERTPEPLRVGLLLNGVSVV